MIAGLTTIGLLFVLDCFLGGLIWYESRRQRAYWARVGSQENVPLFVVKDEIPHLSKEKLEAGPEPQWFAEVKAERAKSAQPSFFDHAEFIRQQREHGH